MLLSTWRVWRRKMMSGMSSRHGISVWDMLMLYFRFKKQFATYLADGVGSEDIEEVFQNAYAAIREDPTFKPQKRQKTGRQSLLSTRSIVSHTSSARLLSRQRSKHSRLAGMLHGGCRRRRRRVDVCISSTFYDVGLCIQKAHSGYGYALHDCIYRMLALTTRQ
jgi:hypothetical protein